MRVQLLVIYWQGVTMKLGNKFWQDGEFMTYFLMSVHARWPHERVVGWNDWLIPVTYVVLLDRDRDSAATVDSADAEDWLLARVRVSPADPRLRAAHFYVLADDVDDLCGVRDDGITGSGGRAAAQV